MLPRERYLPAAGEDTAQWCTSSYIDGALTREEVLTTSAASDAYYGFQRRVSCDNGATWSPPEPIEDATCQLPGGGLATYPGACHFDRRLRSTIRRWPSRRAAASRWTVAARTSLRRYSSRTFLCWRTARLWTSRFS